MNATEVNISRDHVRKLLAAASPDAAMVYLYVSCGNPIEGAEQVLKMGAGRIGCAVATLRQLGLWQTGEKQFLIDLLQSKVDEEDFARTAKKRTRLCTALCGNDAGIIGAAFAI